MNTIDIPQGVSYSMLQNLINEWVIGDNAERDREILTYRLLDGLTYDETTTRYMLKHPDKPICKDTVIRAVKRRSKEVFRHIDDRD